MVICVVKFIRKGYKSDKFFAKSQHICRKLLYYWHVLITSNFLKLCQIFDGLVLCHIVQDVRRYGNLIGIPIGIDICLNSFRGFYYFLNLEIVEYSNSCRKFKFFT